MTYVNPFGTCEDCGTCAIRVEVLDANGIKRLVCRDCRGYYQSKDGEGVVFIGGALEFYKLPQCVELCKSDGEYDGKQ